MLEVLPQLVDEAKAPGLAGLLDDALDAAEFHARPTAGLARCDAVLLELPRAGVQVKGQFFAHVPLESRGPDHVANAGAEPGQPAHVSPPPVRPRARPSSPSRRAPSQSVSSRKRRRPAVVNR